MEQVFGQVLDNREVIEKVYLLTVKAPGIANSAKPGQFVQVRCSENLAPLLRKPFSLHEIDQEKGTVSFLYEVKGQGTKLLTNFKKFEPIDLIGPLGKGFTYTQEGKAILVGGGMGIAPLLPLAKELKRLGREFTIVLGFNDAQKACRLDVFKEQGEVIVATMDGSVGEKGLVLQPLTRELASKEYSLIYACGPEGMLKKVAELADKYQVQCQVSLEAYMACGFGVCLGCVCQTKSLTGSVYSRVCTEGPVFDSKEVVWDEG